jgi:hypothetical protein
MLSKELEILKQIEELYHGDITENEFLQACKGQEKKIEAWREAFEEYPLYEVSKAINHFYVKKSSKTRPNIAQLMAILQETNATKELEEIKTEKVELPFWLKYQQQDRETGDMSWLVPHYQIVGRLIEQNYFPWVQNIYHPSYDDFREAMKFWSFETYGREYFVESDNQFNALPPEVQKAKYEHAREVLKNFSLKGIN